jgi:CubicO group peptidase (beta-lactamase class C family)
MQSLEALATWPGVHAAAVIVRSRRASVVTASDGPMEQRFGHASVTKISSSLAVLIEVEAGRCTLEDQVGPPGSTLAHLLSHASGLPTDGTTPISLPGRRRIYSNTGIELAVSHAAASAGIGSVELVTTRVFEPLGMDSTTLDGSAASGAVGTTSDLCTLAGELLSPTLLGDRLAARQRTDHFPTLAGVLPGFGRQVPCAWGLGVEVKGTKRPHWTGDAWPPASFGHFGQQGGFVVVDVDAGIAVVTLGDEPFGQWAIASWPTFSDVARATANPRQ